MSHRIVSLAARYQQADEAGQAALVAQLEAALLARNTLLQALIDPAPGAVLRLALPAALRARLPKELQGLVEVETEVIGEIEVYHVDGDTPEDSRFHYFLTDVFGDRIELFFDGDAAALTSGATIRGRGALMAAPQAGPFGSPELQLAVGSWEEETLLLDDGGDGATTAGAGEAPLLTNTLGEQRTLVLVVNFQDKPNEQPWTIDEVTQVVFGEASDFLNENSYGQTWLSGDVFGWTTIALDSTVCDNFAVRDLADAAALAGGVDVASYDRLVYIYPPNACGVDGTAQVGAFPSRTWLSKLTLRVVAHELGHNLGLFHAKFLDCGDVALSDDCTPQESGDTLSVLGASGTLGHFSAFDKELLGWLGHGAAPPITTVTSGGTYDLDPYAAATNNVKALKLLQSTDPASGARTWYYLEFRQPLGFDAQIADSGPATTQVFDGVALHLGTEEDANSGHLLDMTPGSDPYIDQIDPTLEPGFTYSDADAGIAVTTNWADAGSAGVTISMTAAPCVLAAPSVQLDPAESLWLAPGSAAAYGVTVTNHDSAACSTASFDLSSSFPAGWTAVFDDPSLTLEPGASAGTGLSVTSSTAAADGFYDIVVTATNGADPAHSGTATATYVVSAPVNLPPTALDDGAVTDEDTSVVISVLANDSDPDGDPLTIVAVIESGNGTCQDNGDGSLTYTPAPGFSGTDVFTYSISDGNGGSDSAAVTVAVAAVNDAPVAQDDGAETAKGTPVTIDLLANDSDPNGDPLVVASVAQGGNGGVVDNGDGTVTYTPDNGFTGSDGFAYAISDGQGGNAGASVAVTVTGPNMPPVAVDDEAIAQGGTEVTVDVLANDSDPDFDPLTVAAVSQGTKGVVSISPEGLVVYLPDAKARGGDSFSYTVTDGEDSATALVTVTFKKGGGGGGSNGGGGGNGKGKGKP